MRLEGGGGVAMVVVVVVVVRRVKSKRVAGLEKKKRGKMKIRKNIGR